MCRCWVLQPGWPSKWSSGVLKHHIWINSQLHLQSGLHPQQCMETAPALVKLMENGLGAYPLLNVSANVTIIQWLKCVYNGCHRTSIFDKEVVAHKFTLPRVSTTGTMSGDHCICFQQQFYLLTGCTVDIKHSLFIRPYYSANYWPVYIIQQLQIWKITTLHEW